MLEGKEAFHYVDLYAACTVRGWEPTGAGERKNERRDGGVREGVKMKEQEQYHSQLLIPRSLAMLAGRGAISDVTLIRGDRKRRGEK